MQGINVSDYLVLSIRVIAMGPCELQIVILTFYQLINQHGIILVIYRVF